LKRLGRTDWLLIDIRLLTEAWPRTSAPSQNWIGKQALQAAPAEILKSMAANFRRSSVGGRVFPSPIGSLVRPADRKPIGSLVRPRRRKGGLLALPRCKRPLFRLRDSLGALE
jgi:hypothetical protein